MRYLSLLPLLFLVSCSSTNGPNDVVETVEICRDCGDGRMIRMSVFDTLVSIADGTCEELRLSDFARVELKGSDTLEFHWLYQDDAEKLQKDLLEKRIKYEEYTSRLAKLRETLTVPLSEKTIDVPCP